nr:hypothetical protein [Microbacterium bovistercoris]
MIVTPDVIGVVVAVFVAAVGFAGVIAGMLHRQTLRLDARFDKMDARFDRMDARFDKMDERFARVEAELVEVKIAVARIEGPRPPFTLAR